MNGEALTADDVAILDAESPTIAGHTCKVIVLDGGPPTLEELRAHVAGRLDRVPRLRQRLVASPGPAWVDDPAFSVDDHVRINEGDDPSGDALRSAAALAMSGRLDRSRPLWDIELLPLVEDERWAVVWRVHHCMADGMTMMRWASQLFWDDDTSDATAARPGPVPATRRPVDAATTFLARARATVSLLRELRPSLKPGPFGGHVGTARQVAFAGCRLDDLRQIEHAAGPGVTVNDVVLAAVAGAIRRWCRAHGAPVGAARAKVPVSMHGRGPDHDELGNRDSFLFVDLPIAEADPSMRLLAVNRETRERKTHHDADALDAALTRLRRLAPSLARAATRLLMDPREFAVNVSNVPGPQRQLGVMGRPLAEMFSIAEVAARHPLRIAAVSLNGSMYFGLCADPEVVNGLDVLAKGIEQSVAELLPSQPGPNTPTPTPAPG